MCQNSCECVDHKELWSGPFHPLHSEILELVPEKPFSEALLTRLRVTSSLWRFENATTCAPCSIPLNLLVQPPSCSPHVFTVTDQLTHKTPAVQNITKYLKPKCSSISDISMCASYITGGPDMESWLRSPRVLLFLVLWTCMNVENI